MGFLGALGGMIAPALNTATQAASSYEGAQANAAIQQRQMMIQALVFARQQRQIEIENQLNEAKARLTNSQSDPNFIRNKAAAEAEGAAPTTEHLQTERIAGEGQNAERVATIHNTGLLGAAGINAGSRIQAADIGQTGATTRQGAQQTFEQGQAARAQAADRATKLAGIHQTQSGGLFSRFLSNDVPDEVPGAAAPQPATPHASNLAPLTPAQIIRRQKDPQYSEFLTTQGY